MEEEGTGILQNKKELEKILNHYVTEIASSTLLASMSLQSTSYL